jgi:DNA-directed RNA polymerase subunit RPC12/RpoP
MASIKCPKCAAPVEFDPKDRFVQCTYCSSLIFIDRSGAGFYYAVPFMIDQNNAVGTFRRWASGPTKAKDLDRSAQVTSAKKEYFPVYLFKRDVNGVEQVQVEPAGSTTLPGLHSLKVPAGDMKVFDGKFDTGGAELIKPDIEMSSYLSTLPGKPKEQALVYFPIWTIDYQFEQKRYKVVVSATSGEVFAAEFPARSSASYLLVAIAGFVAFLAEGYLASQTGMFLLSVILMLVTVLAVFGIAYYVATRM